MELNTLELIARVKELETQVRECRDELCIRCGNYRDSHLGACDGCRWRDV